jgi:hypothetical protein
MTARTLMIGCVAGEGHLDGDDEMPHQAQARLLAEAISGHAGRLEARLIVFKEFPAKYRGALACFIDTGYTRVPSYPMTRLDIDYPSFEAYMAGALSRKTRQDLRVKFRAAAAEAPIELTVVRDIAPVIDVYCGPVLRHPAELMLLAVDLCGRVWPGGKPCKGGPAAPAFGG